MKASRINDRKLRALRRDPIYEAVMVDLCLIGALDKNVVQQLIGREIADHLTSPLEEGSVEVPEIQVVDEGSVNVELGSDEGAVV